MMNVRTMLRALAAAGLLGMGAAAEAQTIAGPITNSANGHEYYVIRIANYDDYRIAAGNLGGYPVVINDAAENAWILANLMPRVSPLFSYAYIGLTDLDREGEWRWMGGARDRYSNWTAGEPNNQSGEDYGMMWRSTGRWNDTVAPRPDTGNGLPFAFVEVGGGNVGQPAGILAGPICDPDTGHTYYLLTGALAGPSNQFAQTNLGGQLATINSAAENDFLARHFGSLSAVGTLLTIGLSDAAVEGTFRWMDGSTAAYRRWQAGEPNNFNDEDTVVMATAAAPAGQLGAWFDTDDLPRPAIIEVVPCPGDFNRSGGVSVQDIFDFLAAYFAGC